MAGEIPSTPSTVTENGQKPLTNKPHVKPTEPEDLNSDEKKIILEEDENMHVLGFGFSSTKKWSILTFVSTSFPHLVTAS